MLKIYAPYVENTNCTPDAAVPSLQTTSSASTATPTGAGWIMTEIDSATAGFCLLTERGVEKGRPVHRGHPSSTSRPNTSAAASAPRCTT